MRVKAYSFSFSKGMLNDASTLLERALPKRVEGF